MDYLCCDPLDGSDLNTSGSSDASSINDGILECDYDTQVTKLYHSIEECKWEEVLYFLDTGKWYSSSFFSAFGDQGDPPSVQARTWVTAIDDVGNVRWCQLPLHAAITFLAPFSVISRLIEVYPKSVRCADDQDMLPLHYAFRFGADDEILLSILEKFPQAITKRAVKNRLPLDLAQYGPRSERGTILDYFIKSAVRKAKVEWNGEYEKMMSGMKDAADSDLKRDLNAKSAKLVTTMAELEKTKKELETLKQAAKDAEREKKPQRKAVPDNASHRSEGTSSKKARESRRLASTKNPGNDSSSPNPAEERSGPEYIKAPKQKRKGQEQSSKGTEPRVKVVPMDRVASNIRKGGLRGMFNRRK